MCYSFFNPPNFNDPKYKSAKSVNFLEVQKDGVAPENFYLTTHLPTYYKLEDKWILPEHNSLNCVAVIDESIRIKEIRELKIGDKVVVGRTTDGSDGILIYKEGFNKSVYENFGHSVESSFSTNYDLLFKLMKYEKENKGHIVWVLGPSVVFDYDTRIALTHLAEAGFVNCLLGGNAIATHDLEGGYLNTALGQNIYTQENMPMGHYNHLDLLNEVRKSGSIKSFIDEGNVKNGFIKKLTEMDIPFVLAGSIRDDGPLPEVYSDVEDSIMKMKEQLNKATLVICLATMLHSVSAANLCSSYTVRENGMISPVYVYSIDVTENVTRKIAAAREMMAVRSIVTNVQDFVVNCERALIEKEDIHEIQNADI
ncbi:MAG: hypothetical protein Q4P34_01605 [Tissierellia bacterium]|nr:hypothetical protein [Tissierellia bacterium]